MADVDFGDLLDYLAGDAASRAILLYMEPLTNAPKFMSAARRAARAKPVIVVKAGRSADGAQGRAVAHRRAGGRGCGLRGRVPPRRRAARAASSTTCSTPPRSCRGIPRSRRATGHPDQRRRRRRARGGPARPISAAVSPSSRRATIAALDAVLPPTWSHGNPVDIIGDAGRRALRARAGRAARRSDDADAILVMNCPTALASSTAVAQSVIAARDGCAQGAAPHARPCSPTGSATRRAASRAAVRRPTASPRFDTPAEAIDGLHAARPLRARAGRADAHAAVAAGGTCDSTRRRRPHVIATRSRAGRSVLSEVEAKALLAAYGIPVVPTDGGARARRGRDEGRRSMLARARAPAWSRSCPTTSPTSPTSAACGSAWRAPRRPAKPRTDMLRAHRALHARRAASRASRCSR